MKREERGVVQSRASSAIRRMRQLSGRRLSDSNGRQRMLLSGAAVLVAAAGLATALLSHAATSLVTAEPESGQLTAPASAVSDTAASGGKAVQFTGSSGTGCAAGEMGTPPNCVIAPPVAAATGKSWKVSFQEEFNGTDYDHTKLRPCFDWNFSSCTSSFNDGREHYLPSQVTVNGGMAHLTAAPLSPPYADSACHNGSCTYKSGLLSTSRTSSSSPYLYSFTYGYIESSFKVINTQGFFTAFWMLPTDPNGNYAYENDIVEAMGYDPHGIYSTYHWNNRTVEYEISTEGTGGGTCPNMDYSLAMHRFGMDWQPDHIAWYIDGKKCGQITSAQATINSTPMDIILELFVDHSWERDSRGKPLLDPTLVRTLDVDYIRVYQQQ